MAWVFAVSAVLGSVIVLLLARRLLGPLATRIVGGVLFLGGIGAVLRHFVTYWLPAAEIYVPALLVVAALGLVAVLSGGLAGVTVGGLGAACGLVAVGLVAAESSHLPEIGSYQRDMFSVAATALGFVAVAASLAAVGRSGALRLTAVGLAVIGAIVTVLAADRLFPVYGEAGEQPMMIAVAAAGVLFLLVLAAALAPRRRARLPVPPAAPRSPVPQGVPRPVPPPQPPVSPVTPQPMPQPQPPAPPPPAVATIGPSAAAGPGRRSRLEIVATIVGLITGTIAIGKELVNLLRSLGG